MESLYLCVDLGGTSLRIALLNAEGKIHVQQTLSSDLVRDEAGLIKVLSQEAELFRFRAEKIEGDIHGMALGIPGLVDSVRGLVRESPHFPAWKDIALRDALRAKLPFPVFLDNDANQAALGEAWRGAGRDWPDFILLTLGTGIGGGIIQSGKIYHGPNGYAGEVGHMVIDRHGLPGALGSRGTLESLASQSGLRLQLEHRRRIGGRDDALAALDPKDPSLPEGLFRLAQNGDPAALEIWSDFGAALGCGIASLANAFGFTRFVIGGGLTAAREFFWESCRRELPRRTYATIAAQLEILPAQLANEAGLIGGVRLIQINL